MEPNRDFEQQGATENLQMKAEFRKAVTFTALWLVAMWLLLPMLANLVFGEYSLLRFDPQVSKDYNCVFVEGYARKGLAVPWLRRSTPIKYFRLRYTPHDGKQPYGIMFVDPQSFAFEAHAEFAKKPTRLAGKLDSPSAIRDWMRSQPHSTNAASHDVDAREILAAMTTLANRDLEHFTLPGDFAMSNFRIGHARLPKRHPPLWTWWALPLVPLWIGVIARKVSKPKPASEGMTST